MTDIYSDVIANMEKRDRRALMEAIREGWRRGLTGAALVTETHRLIGEAESKAMAAATGEIR